MSGIEKSVITSASPETVFRIYQDVENWNAWDPDTKSSHLTNGLTLGSLGSLTPTKGNTVPMEVTAVIENRSFTVTSMTMLFRMDFDHELTPVSEGTLIVHRVKFSGFLKPILSIVVGKLIDKGLPITLQNLKKLAENTRPSEINSKQVTTR